MHRLAIAQKITRVGLIQAAQHCGKRAFSCTIFAKQGVYFTCAHVEVDVVVSKHSREMLDDVVCGERSRGHTT